MTIFDCLQDGITCPRMIAERTDLSLPEASAELLRLSKMLAGQFAKQFTRDRGLPKITLLGRNRSAAIQRLGQITTQERQVLDLALCGVLHHGKAAERLKLNAATVRTIRARLIAITGCKSFEEVVHLVLWGAGYDR